MGNEFDASLACSDPIGAGALDLQRSEVEGWMRMPSALSNAKLHAQYELGRLTVACNRIAWGSALTGLRTPDSAEEIAAMLERLAPDARERLLGESRLANEQRHLIGLIEAAEQQCQALLQAEQAEEAKREKERQEMAEFEAYDLAGKPQRFEAWRAARLGR